jgi:hypothetical protein
LTPAAVPRRGRAGLPLAAAILVAAAVLRTVPLFTEFWYDEILAWRIAIHGASSPLDFLSGRLSETNHPLYSFFFRILGEQPRWEIYRTLSLAAGVATVWLMGAAARASGTAARLSAMFLGAFSSILVLYSTEARGYAPAMFFAVLAYRIGTREAEDAGRAARAAAFGAACALGFLSHPTFAVPWSGLLARSVSRAWREGTRGGGRRPWLRVASFHAFPLAAFLSVLAWTLSADGVGGDRTDVLGQALADFSAYAFGAPAGVLPAAAAGAAVLAAAAFALFLRWKAGDPDRAFFLFTVFLAPAGMAAAFSERPFYARYLLTAAPFLFLLLAGLAPALAARGRAAAAAGAVALVLFAAGNLRHLERLRQDGRGGYAEAFARMAAEAPPGGTATFTSNTDARCRLTLLFYERIGKTGGRVKYLELLPVRMGGETPDWLVFDPRIDRDVEPPAVIPLRRDLAFRKVGTFPSAPLSGFTWVLYRRVPAAR